MKTAPTNSVRVENRIKDQNLYFPLEKGAILIENNRSFKKVLMKTTSNK